MLHILRSSLIILVCFSTLSVADTPPPGTVKAKVLDGSGNAIGSTSGALNVNVTNPGGGTATVNQGSPGVLASPWFVQVTNTPATQVVTGSLGRTWSLLNTTDSVNVGNFPATQAVTQSGAWTIGRTWSLLNTTDSVNVGNFPLAFGRTWSLTSSADSVSSIQSGAWTVGVNNFPASFSVSNFPASFAVSNFPAVAHLNSATDSVTIAGSITTSSAANGAPGSASPSQATMVGGSDGTNLRALKVSSTGVLSVDGSASVQPVSQSAPPWSFNLTQLGGSSFSPTNYLPSRITNGTAYVDPSQIRALSSSTDSVAITAAALPLPANAATSVLQGTANSSLASIDSKLTSPLSVTGAFFQATQPVSLLSLPSLSTGSNVIGSISNTTFTATQATGANLHTVVDSGAVSITGTPNVSVSNFPATQAVSGTVGVSALPSTPAGTNTIGSVKITDGTNTASISSGGSLLISGAAPVGSPPTLNPVSVAAVDGAGNKQHFKVVTGTNALIVDGSAVTQPVSAASLPLPLGASTSVLQSTGNTSLANIATNTSGLPSTLGQKTSAGSLGVVLASDQSAIPITGTITATNNANGTIGSVVPAVGTQVAGSDGTNLRAVKVSASGVVSVDGSAVIQPVSGTVTANQGGTWNVASIINPVAVTGTFFQATQPVSVASLPLSAGAATSINQTNGNQQSQIVQGGNTLSIGSSGNILVSGLTGIGVAPALNPVSISGVDGGGLKRHFLTDVSGKIEIDTAQSLPLPLGASTSALQTSGNTSLANIATNTPALGQALAAGSVPVVLTSAQLSAITPLSTVAITAAALPLPSGAATSALQTSGNTSLATIATNTTLATQGSSTSGQSGELVMGAVSAIAPSYTSGQTNSISLNLAGGIRVDGSGITQPVSASSLPLPTGASTSANQATEIASLANIPAKGAATTANSTPVNIASDQVVPVQANNLTVVGSAAALNADAVVATDVLLYRGIHFQVSGVFTGTLTLQCSEDNFVTVNTCAFQSATNGATAVQTTIVNSAGGVQFYAPIHARYYRLRMTSFTVGTASAVFTASSLPSYQIGANTITGNVATTLASTTLSSGTLTSQATNADVGNGARTTTFVSGSLTPASGTMSASYSVAVNGVSGTSPTMDCVLKESWDSGTTFQDVYHWERITANGVYVTEQMRLTGNRLMYTCTIAGTTPSFTFAINKISSQVNGMVVRKFFDRTINLNLANSTSASWLTEGVHDARVMLNASACTTFPTIGIDTSDDNVNFAPSSAAAMLAITANGTSVSTASILLGKYSKIRVVTAGTTCVLGFDSYHGRGD